MKYEGYRKDQPFTLFEEKEEEFKKNYLKFNKICRILAAAEKYYFNKRAENLKEVHPLAIQVNLKTGVANGVLVVRRYKDCAELLYRVLTNSMEFTIKRKKIDTELGKYIDTLEDVFDATVLEENISHCPYRVVTRDEKLTNSFWNYYLTS